jgi:hypothetical protein
MLAARPMRRGVARRNLTSALPGQCARSRVESAIQVFRMARRVRLDRQTGSGHKDTGSPESCKGTTTTTRCPTTARPCAASDDGSSGTGGRRSRAAARTARSPGSGSTASPHDGYPNPASFTPGPPCASTPKPEGGAQCVDAHAGICAGGVWQRASLPRLLFPLGQGVAAARSLEAVHVGVGSRASGAGRGASCD